MFLDFGSYKQVLTTAGDTELSSIDDIPNPAPFDETFELDTSTILGTGDIWCALKNGTRTGAVRLNGRTIGSASSGGTERANADCADLYAYIWDNTANAQCPVATGRGATAAADFAGNKAITLPDWRAVGPVGFDDMGNTAASLLGSAPVITGSGILPGSLLGSNTHTLLTAETPAHTHTFSATTSSDGAHTHTFSATTATESVGHSHTGTTSVDGSHAHNLSGGQASLNATQIAGSGQWGGGGSGSALSISIDAGGSHQHSFTTSGASATHTHTVSGTTGAVSATHTHTLSGTTSSIGSGSAHNNLARAAPVTWFIKL